MAPPIPLTDYETDDLLYSARLGDVAALQEDIATFCDRHGGCSAAEVLQSAVDAASGNGVAHFAGANGHVGAFPRSLLFLFLPSFLPFLFSLAALVVVGFLVAWG